MSGKPNKATRKWLGEGVEGRPKVKSRFLIVFYMFHRFTLTFRHSEFGFISGDRLYFHDLISLTFNDNIVHFSFNQFKQKISIWLQKNRKL